MSLWLYSVSLNAGNFNEYRGIMGKLESNSNYKAKNTLGYLGKYQLGKLALTDLGYIKDGKWSSKDGLDSEKEFLNSPKLQDKIMDEYTKRNMRYLRNKKVFKYIGKKFKGILVTKSGLLACAHLLGAGGTSRMLKSGNVGKDAYGTKGTEYLKKVKNIKID